MRGFYMCNASLTPEQIESALRPGGVVMMAGGVPQVEIIQPVEPLDFPLGWDERDAKI